MGRTREFYGLMEMHIEELISSMQKRPKIVDANYAPQTAFWCDDIRRITKDGQNEVTVFYELCKRFFEDYKNKTGYFSWRNE